MCGKGKFPVCATLQLLVSGFVKLWNFVLVIKDWYRDRGPSFEDATPHCPQSVQESSRESFFIQRQIGTKLHNDSGPEQGPKSLDSLLKYSQILVRRSRTDSDRAPGAQAPQPKESSPASSQLLTAGPRCWYVCRVRRLNLPPP